MTFRCLRCQKQVSLETLGSKHRNHCPFCLWSRHLDLGKRRRQSACLGEMAPVGLTFKHEGWDKYRRQPKRGELMLIHHCLKCGEISINRIAGDDDSTAILKLFNVSLELSQKLKDLLEKKRIRLLIENDRQEVRTQLFGKSPLSNP